MMQLSGLAMPVPITNDDNAKFKLENGRKLPFTFESSICMNMEMQMWETGLCDYTLVADDNKFRQSCLQSKQFPVPEDKPSQGASQGELSSRWRSWDDKFQHPHTYLAFISCNTHLSMFSLALSELRLSHGPTNVAETPFWVHAILLCAGPFLSSHLLRISQARLSAWREQGWCRSQPEKRKEE